MLVLKRVLRERNISQSRLARELGVSPATVAQMVNHGIWPKRPTPTEMKGRIAEILCRDGSLPPDVFKQDSSASDCGWGEKRAPDGSKDLEDDMLLRKQSLSTDAGRAFKLTRDPFAEVRSLDEVFLTSDFRYVRESLRQTTKHGGFIAVVGESGAGKSTLRKDLAEWISVSGEPVVLIEPYVLGMEDSDIKGKTLKANHVAEAIMAAVAPGQAVKRSPEARFRQVHNALRESNRAGNRHVLVIEEAHSLPLPTLKHLKRFFELEDGFSKLLAIVLIGQSELGQKLDERNPSVREVVQRCEVVTLRPLDDELEGYLRHRFKKADKALEEVMDATAINALRIKLSGRGQYSVLYPLAVHNVVTAALNEAAKLGIPHITAHVIEGV